MKPDYYVDSILGSWTLDKKDKNKKYLTYRREAEVTLHKDHAMPYVDSMTNKNFLVHGRVILNQKKLIEKETSNISYFKQMILTDDSIMNEMIT